MNPKNTYGVIVNIERLLDLLKTLPSCDGLFNPYASDTSNVPGAYEEASVDATAIRIANLTHYLENAFSAGADIVLCGEAPGYQGCRFSGIAFTSETEIRKGLTLLSGCEVLPLASRGQRWPMREPSAQAVWEAMARAERPFILWNAVPLHPHVPGKPLSNRTPKKQEVALGRDALLALLDVVRPRLVVAVGNTARDALAEWGISAVVVRHPAYGGKMEFLAGLERHGVILPALTPQTSLWSAD